MKYLLIFFYFDILILKYVILKRNKMNSIGFSQLIVLCIQTNFCKILQL